MNEEVRESKSIKIRPSILLKAHHKAKGEGKWLARWIEEAIGEKVEREEKKVK